MNEDNEDVYGTQMQRKVVPVELSCGEQEYLFYSLISKEENGNNKSYDETCLIAAFSVQQGCQYCDKCD